MLSLLLVSSKEDMNIPVNYHIIEKTERFIDEKTGKEKRRSKSNKNEILRDMI
jgi:hypothetical protein